uniref:Uncharacterized protein n=1 Tax=Malurus cyaneus samueli TaxID=2593467 RepID=A0A8C5UFJ9_9PASS
MCCTPNSLLPKGPHGPRGVLLHPEISFSGIHPQAHPKFPAQSLTRQAVVDQLQVLLHRGEDLHPAPHPSLLKHPGMVTPPPPWADHPLLYHSFCKELSSDFQPISLGASSGCVLWCLPALPGERARPPCPHLSPVGVTVWQVDRVTVVTG